jgi:myosin I
MTFLNKLNSTVIKHNHFDSREKSVRTDNSLDPDIFRLKHYAGNVTYNVEGFIDKNTDNLGRDVISVMKASTKAGIAECFPEDVSQPEFKRPETIGTQFRTSIQELMENIRSKNPHYLRCIKPNTSKTPDVFDDDLVKHQCSYLGLLENIRVKRAGYCYKQNYHKFVERYKMLSKDTWPKPKVPADKSVIAIMDAAGLPGAEYALGASKVFIKNPQTLWALENKRETKKAYMVSKIRAQYLAWYGKRKFAEMKESAKKIQATFKMYSQKKRYNKKVSNIFFVTRLVKGYLQRRRYRLMLARQPKKAVPIIERFWLKLVRKDFLLYGIREAVVAAGRNWRQVKWPVGTGCTKHMSTLLKRMYFSVMARKYRKSLTPEKKAILEVKAAASNYCEKKKNYKTTIATPFGGDQIGLTEGDNQKKWAKINKENEKVVFATILDKRHRSNPNTATPKVIVLTENNVFLLDGSTLALKEKFELTQLSAIAFSPFADSFFVMHKKNSQKGDYFFEMTSLVDFVEFIGVVSCLVKKKARSVVNITCGESHQININGATMRIKFEEKSDVRKTAVQVEGEVVKVTVSTPIIKRGD